MSEASSVTSSNMDATQDSEPSSLDATADTKQASELNPPDRKVTQTTFLHTIETGSCRCQGPVCSLKRCSCFTLRGGCTQSCLCAGHASKGCRGTHNALFGGNFPRKFTDCFLNFLRKALEDEGFDAIKEDVDGVIDTLRRTLIGHAAPEGDVFYHGTLITWAQNWGARDTADKERENELVQELFRCGLGEGDGVGAWYYSFCDGRWQDSGYGWHFPTCEECKVWSQWHCKACKTCRYGLQMPCSRCGGVSEEYGEATEGGEGGEAEDDGAQ